jgi:predicted HTH transcriptional regulator
MDEADLTLDEVLEELSDYFLVETPQEGDFTFRDLMDRFDLTLDQARRKVKNLVEAGKLIEFRYKSKNYYRKVDEG